MPWGEGSEGWGVGTRGPCQGDGGEGGANRADGIWW